MSILLNVFWPTLVKQKLKADYRSRKLNGQHREALRLIRDGKSVDHIPDGIISDLRWNDYIDREFHNYSLTEKAYKIRGIKQ